MATVNFKDNSAKILREFKTATGAILNMIGARAAEHIADLTPVRTGNLVNHVDWEVGTSEKEVEMGIKKGEDEEHSTDYAIYVENGSRNNVAHHMVQRGVMENMDEYKDIAEQGYRNA